MRRSLAVLLSVLFANAMSSAAEFTLDRPGNREFVPDNASLLTELDKAAIVAICDTLLTNKATPIIVIKINGARSLRMIKSFLSLSSRAFPPASRPVFWLGTRWLVNCRCQLPHQPLGVVNPTRAVQATMLSRQLF